MENSQKFELKPWINAREFEQKIKKIVPGTTLILFDLDETLLSHRQFVSGRLQYALGANSNQMISEMTKKSIHARIANVGTSGILDFINREIDPSLAVTDLKNFLRRACPLEESDLVRPKLKALFQVLSDKFEIKICTNGNIEQQKLKVGILESHLNSQLSVFYCEQIKPKPSPECLIRALGNKSTSEALFIGDSVVDEEAANLAAIPFINANWFES
jgi:phosphoglycolate phosphatase-like HAD superfamily hydrolase